MELLKLTCFIAAFYVSQATLSKRFEYKHSFKGPHLVQKDRTVPFWTYIGNAIASDDFVRLAPSLKSQRGLIWNKIATTYDNWEVELTFKVAGRGRVGADGLAFWYTMEAEGMTGSVFGSRDNWKGLGVFFDSFDNDAGNNNPYISAQLNDGSRKFDHHTDGSQHNLGGCMRDYRNKPYPVKAKIRYENKVLTIYTSSGLTKFTEQEENSDHLFDLCAYVPNLELSTGGHFSVSAATGGLADDHDVLSFLAHSLRTEEEMKSKQTIADDVKERYVKEFEEYDKQLNEAKDEYQKENPDAVEKDDDEYFDNDVRELKMIFDGQDHIHQSISAINKRLNELMGSSQQLSTQIAQLQQGSGAVAHQAGGAPAPPPAAGSPSIQRHEVEHLIKVSNDLTQQLSGLKSSVEGISRDKRDAPGNVPNYADKNFHQINDNMNEVKLVVKQMQSDAYAQKEVNKKGGAAGCPNTNCVSTFYFGAFIVGQVAILLGYSFYSSRRDAAAKKFY